MQNLDIFIENKQEFASFEKKLLRNLSLYINYKTILFDIILGK